LYRYQKRIAAKAAQAVTEPTSTIDLLGFAEIFMRRILLYVATVSFALSIAPANASSRTGTVAGIVVDRNGRPASGAHVMIERSDGSAPVATRTNSSGRFQFKFVLSGSYDIRASRGATATVWRHNLRVRTGKETKIELRLEPIERKPTASAAPPRTT
jgi:hypothetical protein